MGALVSVATVEGAYPAFSDVAAGEQTRRILAASASVEAFVGRPLAQATFVETHRPESSRRLYLRATPIASITSIVYGVPGSQATLATADYSVLDAEAGVVELYRDFSGGFRWPDRAYGGDPRAGSLVVIYVGGYALADVPADIQDAVIHAVLARGATVGLSGGGMYASEQLGSYSYRISSDNTSSATTAGLPTTVTGPLRKYKRVRIA